ncbi:MAG: hypothetical protein IJU91_10450, partial [Selenomonadaceae bacterium]|nr:hypothetical protein [Selenomonadaceae bacterium]
GDTGNPIPESAREFAYLPIDNPDPFTDMMFDKIEAETQTQTDSQNDSAEDNLQNDSAEDNLQNDSVTDNLPSDTAEDTISVHQKASRSPRL